MIKKIKVLLFTFLRSDLGPQISLINEFKKNKKKIDVSLIMTGLHLTKKYKSNSRDLNSIKINNLYKIILNQKLIEESKIHLINSELITNISKIIEKKNIDLIILFGDRSELLSFPIISLYYNVPMLHIGGGHITEGSYDDNIRHSLTKFSHLHAVSNSKLKKRLLNLGEESWRVINSGSLSKDFLVDYIEANKINKNRTKFKKVIVCYHPSTMSGESPSETLENILKNLILLNFKILITFPNNDTNFKKIIEVIELYKKKYPQKIQIHINLGQINFLKKLNECSFVIGNSSSIFIQTPYLGLPAINVGIRQKGRTLYKNILHSNTSFNDINNKINHLLKNYNKLNVQSNPYGKKNSAQIINKFIQKIFFSEKFKIIMNKKNLIND